MGRNPAVPKAVSIGLSGTVERVGRLPKVPATERNAATADLRIRLTGSTPGKKTRVRFVLSLNTAVATRSSVRLLDESAASGAVLAKGSGNNYDFGSITIDEPGAQAARVFRIVNIRANANGVPPSSSLMPAIVAVLSLTSRDGVRVSGSEQVIANVKAN